VVSTLAGNGFPGYADGNGYGAAFNQPYGVAVDASGNIYVADRFNLRIRKIVQLPDGTGQVTTLAGNRFEGDTDSTGANASFRYPAGIAVDASGNIYVADTDNHKIRKIVPLPDGTGRVSTLAGSGSYGNSDGPGTTATFNGPSGVAIDASGNIYVASYWNYNIRKIITSANGSTVVTTLAGSGSLGNADGYGAAAFFNQATGVAVDASGNVYVADKMNNKIRKIIAR
jgi:streptogramin lyase